MVHGLTGINYNSLTDLLKRLFTDLYIRSFRLIFQSFSFAC
jgi:hypothetical protein